MAKPKNPYKKKHEAPLLTEMYELLRDEQKKQLETLRHKLIEEMDCYEELYYYGTTWGWTPRYCYKRNKVVAVLHLLPGLLEGSISLSTLHLQDIKNSANILDAHKALLEPEENFQVTKWITMDFNLSRDIDSFIEIAKIKKKFLVEATKEKD